MPLEYTLIEPIKKNKQIRTCIHKSYACENNLDYNK